METLQEQLENSRSDELKERIAKLEKNFAYMQKDMETVVGLMKELQRFFITLAAEHKQIQTHVKQWPFVMVNPVK